MTGTHIDTVWNGGLYDGLLGVHAALEVIDTIKEKAVSLQHLMELVTFAVEEGSDFNCTMLGSKVITGKLGLDDLHTSSTTLNRVESLKPRGKALGSFSPLPA